MVRIKFSTSVTLPLWEQKVIEKFNELREEFEFVKVEEEDLQTRTITFRVRNGGGHGRKMTYVLNEEVWDLTWEEE